MDDIIPSLVQQTIQNLRQSNPSLSEYDLNHLKQQELDEKADLDQMVCKTCIGDCIYVAQDPQECRECK